MVDHDVHEVLLDQGGYRLSWVCPSFEWQWTWGKQVEGFEEVGKSQLGHGCPGHPMVASVLVDRRREGHRGSRRIRQLHMVGLGLHEAVKGMVVEMVNWMEKVAKVFPI